ncbi:hypothetical protein Ngar_c16240 [Candidatus Nitrososphaera gargensis Ga9.2]|uniref:Uncharacterized protein n=1 Tax=Nitrososphaera gargensis (strain Ga9.2) TaxID=1237085 RepID=K0IJW1_NITGG|nr:hypothetical protein Ngar_c16240 [Candidatus Nitrososphaera gargensis Ga9.2]
MSQDTTIQSEPIRKLFQGKNFGFLAMLIPDGPPQVMPTLGGYREQPHYYQYCNG